jgi:hypothetical protein
MNEPAISNGSAARQLKLRALGLFDALAILSHDALGLMEARFHPGP